MWQTFVEVLVKKIGFIAKGTPSRNEHLLAMLSSVQTKERVISLTELYVLLHIICHEMNTFAIFGGFLFDFSL